MPLRSDITSHVKKEGLFQELRQTATMQAFLPWEFAPPETISECRTHPYGGRLGKIHISSTEDHSFTFVHHHHPSIKAEKNTIATASPRNRDQTGFILP